MRYTCRVKRQDGMSLLEVMIAILVLMVGVVGVAQLVPASLRSSNDSRSDSVALVLAQRELDQMVEQPLKNAQFTDVLGNVCTSGILEAPNTVFGSTVAALNDRPMIDLPRAKCQVTASTIGIPKIRTERPTTFVGR